VYSNPAWITSPSVADLASHVRNRCDVRRQRTGADRRQQPKIQGGHDVQQISQHVVQIAVRSDFVAADLGDNQRGAFDPVALGQRRVPRVFVIDETKGDRAGLDLPGKSALHGLHRIVAHLLAGRTAFRAVEVHHQHAIRRWFGAQQGAGAEKTGDGSGQQTNLAMGNGCHVSPICRGIEGFATRKITHR
jgi:hypothetical protein